MGIIISEKILDKLGKKVPPISKKDVEECFINRYGGLLEDAREEHKTTPPTLWFVAPNNKNQMIKIMYVQDGENIYIKSAYSATHDIIRIYEKFAL